jgi:hypothetical protein
VTKTPTTDAKREEAARRNRDARVAMVREAVLSTPGGFRAKLDAADEVNEKFWREHPGKHARYNHSEKGKARSKRYERKRYAQQKSCVSAAGKSLRSSGAAALTVRATGHTSSAGSGPQHRTPRASRKRGVSVVQGSCKNTRPDLPYGAQGGGSQSRFRPHLTTPAQGLRTTYKQEVAGSSPAPPIALQAIPTTSAVGSDRA